MREMMMNTQRSPQNPLPVSTKRETDCPTCAVAGKVIGLAMGEEVFRCPDCKLCFLKRSVRPQSANDNRWYQNLVEGPDQWAKNYVDMMGEAYEKQVRELERFTSGRNLLDVGCGIGVFLSVAKKQGWSVTGVEESEWAAKFAAKHYGVQYASKLDEIAPASMDVIRLSHVLEHIPEPHSFLQELATYLKPGGILQVFVPNREPFCATVVNRLRRLTSKTPKLAGAIYPDMHVLGFSTGSLSHMLGHAGYDAKKVFTVSMGNRTYFPMFYDGLLTIHRGYGIRRPKLFSFWLPQLLDNLGNPIGRGNWVVGYFQKRS